MKARVVHRTEVRTRSVPGSRLTVYELFVDGLPYKQQISPFGADEIAEAKRIGPRVDRFACRITEPSRKR